jgi:hypothetical protein
VKRPRLPDLNLSAPVLLTRKHVLAGGGVVGVALAITLLLVAVALVTVIDVQQDQITANRERLDDQARLDDLERPPTERELAAASLEALKSCGASPACRDQFRDVIRRAGVRRGDVPRLARDLARRSPSSSTSSSSSATITSGRGSRPATPPRRRRPTPPPTPTRPPPPAPVPVVPLPPVAIPPAPSPLVPPVTVPDLDNSGPGRPPRPDDDDDDGHHRGPGHDDLQGDLEDLADELNDDLREGHTTPVPSAIVQRRTPQRPGARPR